MTPERWDQVKGLFRTALEREPAGRGAFLAEACAEDPALRTEVESLISFHEEAEDFLEAAAIEIPIKAIAEEEGDEGESMAGRRIGPYELLREIGRGGMGAVYLADRVDGQYRKKVAIKLVKRGMDTDSILRRFRNERQILAGLDHPNIARLLDGGTTEEGLPYFVMEYAAGKSLYEYCDAQSLPTTDRLELFRTVCSAVSYAHEHQVIHRDLKPSNILVTADGTPKLLDFGIAKLISSEFSSQTVEAATATGWRLMTPECASPEQVRGEEITAASDVYSLGVLLYELLTGHRPYRWKSRQPHEIARVICEEEPERPTTAISRFEEIPSADDTGRMKLTPESVARTRDGNPAKLRRRLAGDLENIVLKAIRKEPRSRYTSVEEFSEDLRRHLEGLPVIARKATLGYRAGKFLRRHRTGALASGLAATAVLAAMLAIIQQGRIRPTQPVPERGLGDIHFQAPANYVVGSRPYCVAVEDFNGDRLADLAVANWVSNDVSVLRGKGDGTFQAVGSFAAGSTPVSIAVADFNRDSRQDLALANLESTTVSVLLGRGDGTFQGAKSYEAGSAPRSVAVGDFNRDGRQDLAVASMTSNEVSLLLGKGDGEFQWVMSFCTGDLPVNVAVADFDANDRPDLAVANHHSHNISVLLGDGDATFQRARDYPAAVNPHSIGVGDFNGDGWKDLAVTNLLSTTISVLAGRGDGTFEAAMDYGGGGGGHSVVVHDFNGDGREDLAVANIYFSNVVSVLLGEGDGSFRVPVNFAAGANPAYAAAGDFNSDGLPDLAVANSGWPRAGDTVSILINNTRIKRPAAPRTARR